jgi:endonuclease/exonuclease/phosphatase (EEP) superfamily protein YafD
VSSSLVSCGASFRSSDPALERAPQTDATLRVLVWNILRGANNFDNGPEKALRVIQAVSPDVCLIQESYDIDGPRPTLGRWLAEQLGWNVYQGSSPHLCILTPLNIEQTWHHHDWHAVGARLKDHAAREFVVYSIWIDYRAYITYALRDDPTISDADLLAHETEKSARFAQATAILKHLEASGHLAADVPLLVGGDWNCPSHLDWTPETALIYRFRRPLDLPVSRAMSDAGFTDTFRVIYPNPVQHPGITWSPLHLGEPTKPETADRIDRLYQKGSSGAWRLEPVGAHVLPREWEPMHIPQVQREFPSDHSAMAVDFEWRRAQ